MRSAFILLSLLFCFGSANAGTIRVARDGTGDFTLVADGVLAAASGDTVSIGPGEYPETRVFETPGGLYDYVARVDQTELTIIGDDRDSVILGPETPAPDLESGPSGIVTTVDGNVRLQGVTLQNLSSGVQGNGQWMEVQSCRFTGSELGLDSFLTGFTTVRDCEFRGNVGIGLVVFEVRGSTGALVEGCSFRDNRTALDFQPDNCELRDSTFEGGQIGAQVSFGGSALIERCTFSGLTGPGLILSGGAQGAVYDCTFSPGGSANIDVSGLLLGSGNELGGGVARERPNWL